MSASGDRRTQREVVFPPDTTVVLRSNANGPVTTFPERSTIPCGRNETG